MKDSLATQNSEFSRDESGSVKMPDVFGNVWRNGQLHAWLSHEPEQVRSCGMMPPVGKLAIALIGFGIVSIVLLIAGGGYLAIGKMQELAEQGGSFGISGYENDISYASSDVDEAVPESADPTPDLEPPLIEESPLPIPDKYVTGTLTADSQKLTSGEFAYKLDLTVQAGLNLTIDLTSPDFGTYLIVVGPDGENIQNDDFEGDPHHSQVTFTAEEDGIYNIIATTGTIGETGGFKIEWTVNE